MAASTSEALAPESEVNLLLNTVKTEDEQPYSESLNLHVFLKI